MIKQKNPYTKPEITIIQASIPRHSEFMVQLKAEDANTSQQGSVPSPHK